MNKYDRIENIVYNHYDRDVAEIRLKSRKDEYKIPRFVTWYFLRQNGLSLSEIGRHYLKDHATIYNAVNRVDGWRQSDRVFGLRLQALKNEIDHDLTGVLSLPFAKFAFKKSINIIAHICPMCKSYVHSLPHKTHTHCQECGTKIKLQI